MEPNYVKAARESGNISPIVTAGLMAFCKGAVTGTAAGLMLSACLIWWEVLYRGGTMDWTVVEAAEEVFGFDCLKFMTAIGLA